MVKPLAAAWMLGLGSLPAAWSYPFQGSTMQAVSEHPAACMVAGWKDFRYRPSSCLT